MAAEQVEQDPLSIQTVRANGTAPKRRIASPQAGLTAYREMRQVESRRDLRFNGIAGIFAGFPPIPPETMDEMGLGGFPNINTKQFEAKINTYVDNWVPVNAAGSEWFEVKARHEDPMEAERRSKKISEHFNSALRKWNNPDDDNFACSRDYVIRSGIRDIQMGLFGIGVSFFNDPIDFRWKPIPTRKVLVPEGTNLLLDNCPFLAIEDDYSVPDLWAMRDKAGWNKDAITALLYLNTCRTNQYTNLTETWAEWTERIRENDNWLYSDFPLVRIIHLFVKEFTSGANKADITHCIISDAYPTLSGMSETGKQDVDKAKDQAMSWLYEEEKVATRWSQVLSVFSDNVGAEGRWHGVKGTGDLIFDNCHLNNEMFNKAAQGVIVANTLLFRAQNEESSQKLKQVKITPFGILNPGLDIEQIKLQPDIQNAIGFFNVGTNLVNSNSRQYPVGDQKSYGEAPTATQVNADRADQAQFTSKQIMLYRSTGLDPLGAEMYRRIAQSGSKYPESWPGGDVAKQFRDACKADGIPEADLLKVDYVRANRNIGTGNMALDIMQSDQLMTVATPGQGQLNARYKKACAIVGSDAAGAFVQIQQPPPDFEDTVISQEDLFIQNGQTPTAIGSQPHERHLGVGMPTGHVTTLMQAEQIANQMLEAGVGSNLEAANRIFRVLQSGIEHSAQHVAFMEEMPRIGGRNSIYSEQVKELNKMLNDFSQFTEHFGEELQKAQAEQNPQAGMTPEQQKVQAEIENKRAITMAGIEDNRLKTQAKLENDQIKTMARSEQAVASHQQKLGMQAYEQTAKLQGKELEQQQKLRENALKTAQELGANAAFNEQELQESITE